MALRSFRMENQKALRIAECTEVPAVMVIAGPNGVGKSTLLYVLKQKQGAVYDEPAQILYQPPHRAIRRQRVQRRWLGGALRRFSEILSGGEVSGFEGLSIQFPQRIPDNVDEAGSTVKYTLGKIENRRQNVLARLVDAHRREGRSFETRDLADVYEPLMRLTSRLLPHLAFKEVDFSDEDNIRVVFTRTDAVGSNELDLDDLSSGEKSILLLFLPLVEDEINRHLESLTPGGARQNAAATSANRVFLIDEPEQHLHPDLQARILGYVRDEAGRTGTQFIMTTHSPALVDQAFDNELYVLTPPHGAGVNQLRRVATSIDRLEAVKALAGTTYVVTTGRPIICLEGAREVDSKPSDVRLLEIMYPRASHYTFVPVGGKGNVIRVVQGLRRNLPEEHFGIKVFGLVDMDRSRQAVGGVVVWSVATVENLLLHAEGIAETVNALVPGRNMIAAQARDLLLGAAQSQRELEIGLRVMDSIGARTIRIRGVSVAEIRQAINREVGGLNLTDEQIEKMIADATAIVDQSLADGSYLKAFRGKDLLREVYGRLNLGEAQISFERFAYALARSCGSKAETKETLDGVFTEIERQRKDARVGTGERVRPAQA